MNTQDFLGAIPGASPSGKLPETFLGFNNDTRTLKPGECYVALRGAAHDGHDYVAQALRAGAAAALVDKDWVAPPEAADWPLVRVPDTLLALQKAATAWRSHSAAFIIGVTGSSGKTTTRQMTAALLSGGGPTRSTMGNFNNGIGLPLSMLKLEDGDRFGVFEAGTNHPGEIARLANIMRPNAAIIASIGTAHIGFFGSTEAIANEKADLLRVLPSSGFAVLSREVLHFDLLAGASAAPVTTVSLHRRDVDFAGEWSPPDPSGVASLRVTERATGEKTLLEYPLPGEHNASDLLLAFAAARRAGVTAAQAVEGLSRFSLPGNRWEVKELDGVTYINDAYNANPDSMAAALTTFLAGPRPAAGRRIVALGDMRELGDQAEALHAQIGRRVAELRPDALFAIGECSATALAKAAVGAGFPAAQVFGFPDAAAARGALHAFVRAGDRVLLKASRGMALEKLLSM